MLPLIRTFSMFLMDTLKGLIAFRGGHVSCEAVVQMVLKLSFRNPFMDFVVAILA